MSKDINDGKHFIPRDMELDFEEKVEDTHSNSVRFNEFMIKKDGFYEITYKDGTVRTEFYNKDEYINRITHIKYLHNEPVCECGYKDKSVPINAHALWCPKGKE